MKLRNFLLATLLDSWLTLLSKCSKWRLSKNRGLVADGWFGVGEHNFHYVPRNAFKVNVANVGVGNSVGFSGMFCSFVTTLHDDYKR